MYITTPRPNNNRPTETMARQFLGDNFTIDLEQIPAYKLLSGTFHAQCDKQLMDMLAVHPQLHPNSRKMVADMAKTIRDNRITVRYAPRHGLGRRYAEVCHEPRLPNGRKNPDFGVLCGSLVGLPRLAKNTVFKYHGWTDLDQVKGHPTIICELGLKAKHAMEAYQEYLQPGAFDRICKEVCDWHNQGVAAENHIVRKDVKLLFNRTIYGGGFAGWVKEIEDGKRDPEDPAVWVHPPRKISNSRQPHAFYIRFAAETQQIIDLAYANNPELQKRVCKDLPLPDDAESKEYTKVLRDRKGRVMSYVCGIIENDLTFVALSYLIKKGVITDKVCDLGYDGLTFPTPTGDFCIDRCLADLNAHVRKTTGFKTVAFAHKEFDEWLDDALQERLKLPAEPEWEDAPEVHNHRDASKVIYGQIKDRVVHSQGATFMRVGESQYWVSDAAKLQSHLMLLIADTAFMQYDKKRQEMVSFHFGGCHKECAQILKFVMAEIHCNADDLFYDKFHDTTEGRICFQDGVYDFREGQFYRWGSLPWEYHSCAQIPMDGAPLFAAGAQDAEAMAELRSTLFEPLFGDKCELALAAFARNIAGEWKDKVFSAYFGNRNCGKGVAQRMMEAAFGPYIQAVDVANFVCVRAQKVDNAKDKAWALPMEFARLTFGQENSAVDVTQKYNGNLIKSLCSGTDRHLARKLYENARSFKIQSSLILMGNDELDISPADTWEKGLRFSSTVQFKDQAWIDQQRAAGAPEILLESYRPADPTILTRCSSDRWRVAMIHLLVQAYRSTPVVIPRDEIAETDLGGSLRSQILAKYDLTRNPSHTVLNADIDAWRVSAGLGVSAAKVYTELKALGCQPGMIRGKRLFRGLVARIDTTDQETDTD